MSFELWRACCVLRSRLDWSGSFEQQLDNLWRTDNSSFLSALESRRAKWLMKSRVSCGRSRCNLGWKMLGGVGKSANICRTDS